MAIEIERKYLVKSELWQSRSNRKFYQQGYLLIGKTRTIRVRIIDDSGFLTVKGASIGISRSEFEYEIPADDAKFMLLNLCEKPLIEKYRTKIELNGLVWEMDEFLGENEGLILAEVELLSEDQEILLPDWIGKEVTGNPMYNNSYLVKNPFKKWKN